MSTELMVAAQFCMFLLLSLLFMLIYLAKLRKANRQLRAAFDKLKDDLNGVSIATHLEEVEKQTLAACKKDSPIFDPDHAPYDQGIALRAMALGTELSVLEMMQRGRLQFERSIAPYIAIGDQISKHITKIREDLRSQLSADYQQRINELQRQVDALQRKYKPMEDNYRKVQLLMDVFEYEEQDRRTKDEMEQMFHNALAKACDGFKTATAVREIVFLYHEAFFDRRNGGGAPAAPSGGGVGIGLYAMQNYEALVDIVNQQQTLMFELQATFEGVTDQGTRGDLDSKAVLLEDRINEARHTLELLGGELRKAEELSDSGTYNSPEIIQVIEQFTEESAQMVERIHMLSNQNKMLAAENEQLRLQSEAEGGGDNSLVMGLKNRIHMQEEEILQLQGSYKDLEARFLSLYEEKRAS